MRRILPSSFSVVAHVRVISTPESYGSVSIKTNWNVCGLLYVMGGAKTEKMEKSSVSLTNHMDIEDTMVVDNKVGGERLSEQEAMVLTDELEMHPVIDESASTSSSEATKMQIEGGESELNEDGAFGENETQACKPPLDIDSLPPEQLKAVLQDMIADANKKAYEAEARRKRDLDEAEARRKRDLDEAEARRKRDLDEQELAHLAKEKFRATTFSISELASVPIYGVEPTQSTICLPTEPILVQLDLENVMMGMREEDELLDSVLQLVTASNQEAPRQQAADLIFDFIASKWNAQEDLRAKIGIDKLNFCARKRGSCIPDAGFYLVDPNSKNAPESSDPLPRIARCIGFCEYKGITKAEFNRYPTADDQPTQGALNPKKRSHYSLDELIDAELVPPRARRGSEDFISQDARDLLLPNSAFMPSSPYKAAASSSSSSSLRPSSSISFSQHKLLSLDEYRHLCARARRAFTQLLRYCVAKVTNSFGEPRFGVKVEAPTPLLGFSTDFSKFGYSLHFKSFEWVKPTEGLDLALAANIVEIDMSGSDRVKLQTIIQHIWDLIGLGARFWSAGDVSQDHGGSGGGGGSEGGQGDSGDQGDEGDDSGSNGGSGSHFDGSNGGGSFPPHEFSGSGANFHGAQSSLHFGSQNLCEVPSYIPKRCKISDGRVLQQYRISESVLEEEKRGKYDSIMDSFFSSPSMEIDPPVTNSAGSSKSSPESDNSNTEVYGSDSSDSSMGRLHCHGNHEAAHEMTACFLQHPKGWWQHHKPSLVRLLAALDFTEAQVSPFFVPPRPHSSSQSISKGCFEYALPARGEEAKLVVDLYGTSITPSLAKQVLAMSFYALSQLHQRGHTHGAFGLDCLVVSEKRAFTLVGFANPFPRFEYSDKGVAKERYEKDYAGDWFPFDDEDDNGEDDYDDDEEEPYNDRHIAPYLNNVPFPSPPMFHEDKDPVELDDLLAAFFAVLDLCHPTLANRESSSGSTHRCARWILHQLHSMHSPHSDWVGGVLTALGV